MIAIQTEIQKELKTNDIVDVDDYSTLIGPDDSPKGVVQGHQTKRVIVIAIDQARDEIKVVMALWWISNEMKIPIK